MVMNYELNSRHVDQAPAGRAHRVIASEAGAICWQLRNEDNRSLDCAALRSG
jgi:hypothetical protein